MKLYYILFICSIFLFPSCSNDDDQGSNNRSESLVFGSFAGECFGNCFDIFRIDNTKLEEDRVVDFFTQNYSFKGSFTFSNQMYLMYRNILNEIPTEFINGSDKTYGCPDCADQGGFYFEVTTAEGKTKKYIVDTNNTDDQSAEIITFKNRISDLTKDLKVVN